MIFGNNKVAGRTWARNDVFAFEKAKRLFEMGNLEWVKQREEEAILLSIELVGELHLARCSRVEFEAELVGFDFTCKTRCEFVKSIFSGGTKVGSEFCKERCVNNIHTNRVDKYVLCRARRQ